MERLQYLARTYLAMTVTGTLVPVVVLQYSSTLNCARMYDLYTKPPSVLI